MEVTTNQQFCQQFLKQNVLIAWNVRSSESTLTCFQQQHLDELLWFCINRNTFKILHSSRRCQWNGIWLRNGSKHVIHVSIYTWKIHDLNAELAHRSTKKILKPRKTFCRYEFHDDVSQLCLYLSYISLQLAKMCNKCWFISIVYIINVRVIHNEFVAKKWSTATIQECSNIDTIRFDGKRRYIQQA